MLKLEGLTLSGFKSFVDRTDILFPEGVTCVVGPNGCGKSNIVDAIAWVLGEQSPKQLRGAKMEEVIFAGTRSRKPAGMAEVSLHFAPKLRPEAVLPDGERAAREDDDVDPRLKEALLITRRLYRNGDSEYLINGERARLKDITSLIMGTGMGTRVYSIIEQGRVGQILNSKPTERRVLIEEAAGVTRYKARRKAAKLRLDESEQSLLRVSDIVGELERQLRSLKRQVGTARRYRRLAGRRRIVLRALHAVKFRTLTQRLRDVESDLLQLQDSASESAESLSSLEDGTRQVRESVAALEARRDAVFQHAHGLQLELEGSRHAIGSARQRIQDLATRISVAQDALRSLDREVADLDGARSELSQRRKRLDGELAATRDSVEAAATGNMGLRERLAQAHRTIAETKESIFEVLSEAAGLRNRKQEIESALTRLEAMALRLEASLGETTAQLNLVMSDLEAGEARLEKALAEEKRLGAALASTSHALDEAAQKVGRLRAQRDESLAGLHDAEWHLAAIAETIRSRAAYAEGVRRFLDQPPAGVMGAVADFATVESGDELAVEKALGRFLQGVVLASREVAERVAKSLAEAQKAEIHFVFPESSGLPPAGGARLADKRILRPISECVTFDKEVSWLAAVLPQAWLVANAKDALALARKHPDEVFVSRDGVLMGPGGSGSAGRPLGEGDGILETRARRERLEKDVTKRRGLLDEMDAQVIGVEAERDRLATERENLRTSLASSEKDVVAARHDVAGLRQNAGGVEARHAALKLEHESVAGERDSSRKRLEDLALKLAAATTAKADQERKLAKTTELAARLEGEAEGADAALSRLREELAVKAERRESARLELARAEAELERRAALRAEAAAQASTLEIEKTETERLLARTETAVAEGSDRFTAMKAEMESAEIGVRSGRTGLLESAERLRDLRLEHERRTKLAGEAEVRRERLLADLEHVVADCREKLSVEPDELPMPEPPPPAPAAETRRRRKQAAAEAPVVEAVATEEAALAEDVEMAEDDAAIETEAEAALDESLPWVDGELDLAALETESDDLRKRLDRIGPVNLVAIEEYDGLVARHGFLSKEQSDLVESIKSLRRTIGEIDEMSKERFTEAFEAIKGDFDKAFQTLFRGGRAELRLQDEEDPLECGIEIIAQPPGKRLQNMMLLSGGEKALTAIALLFALFRYKPSPFCVLDEVDAPLDESNVLRFLDLVQDLSKDTQFVLVTHDRRSMERGKVLYGVTMQEPGCSKLVSVRFDGVGEVHVA